VIYSFKSDQGKKGGEKYSILQLGLGREAQDPRSGQAPRDSRKKEGGGISRARGGKEGGGGPDRELGPPGPFLVFRGKGRGHRVALSLVWSTGKGKKKRSKGSGRVEASTGREKKDGLRRDSTAGKGKKGKRARAA